MFSLFSTSSPKTCTELSCYLAEMFVVEGSTKVVQEVSPCWSELLICCSRNRSQMTRGCRRRHLGSSLLYGKNWTFGVALYKCTENYNKAYCFSTKTCVVFFYGTCTIILCPAFNKLSNSLCSCGFPIAIFTYIRTRFQCETPCCANEV